MPSNKETFLGYVQDVNGMTVRILLSKESLSGFIYINGQGYRVGQIGSFIRIPIGFIDLFGIISQVGASAAPEKRADNEHEKYSIEDYDNNNWMTIQLIGESQRSDTFQRGISQYPTIGDEVHLVSEKELKNIYGQPDKPYFLKIGHISNAESIPALIDVNKLVTRHSAVVGTTGSGKSTTVASIMHALSDQTRYPASRIIMLDIHGEYGAALSEKANIYKINASKSSNPEEKELYIPFWALNFDELCEISFGEFNSEKDKYMVLERIQKSKVDSLMKFPIDGVSEDTLNVDTPISFSIHHLWYELYKETFGTYYNGRGGKPLDHLAYEVDDNERELRGEPSKGVPPIFKNIVTGAGKQKINHLPDSSNIRKQLDLLGAKLRIPRYDFIFKPGNWSPNETGEADKDLDSLLKGWIGDKKPVTILDLSGVPVDILNTIIGALLRILYEALFWSRKLSQGGRHRPLLLVMEEAHTYLNDDSKGIASKVVQRVVKEGRKYGMGAMIVSQRPSDINSTILSQCGTFFALRLNNNTDRGHITSTVPDNLEGLTSMLPILRTGEAIILGESVKLPMRSLIMAPAKDKRPDSQDPIVYAEVQPEDSRNPGGWGIRMEDDPNYNEVVETWRAQDHDIKLKDENMNMKREPVESSNIQSIGYEEDSQTLEIEFLNDTVYQYFDVQENRYKELMNAESHGKYLAEHIKGFYRYSKV